MPYITDERKQALSLGDHMRAPGELNYTVCKAVVEYLDDQVNLGRKISYSLLAEALSQVLEAEAELRRRLLVPYEKKKQEENGDVFPDWLRVAVGEDEWLKADAHPGYNEDKLRHNSVADDCLPKEQKHG